MHVVIRSYTGAGAEELFELIAKREDEVRELLSSVSGFVSYAAITHDGHATTVTVCQDKAGTDESTQRAAQWVGENAEVAVDPPAITEGDTVVAF
jgi:hypothetical protein